MFCTFASLATSLPPNHGAAPLALLAQAGPGYVISPAIIVVLCVIAGIGTMFMLPGRKDTSWPRIGGLIALAAAVIFVGMIAHYDSEAPGSPGHMSFYFWIFSVIAVFSALRVITHPRPVYSALYFVLTVVASAGLFVLLWSEFLAAALVVIYAGAILVTYVFVIMLAQQASQQQPGDPPLAGLADYDRVSRDPLVASAVGFALMGVLLFVVFDKAGGLTTAPAARPMGSVPAVMKAVPPAHRMMPRAVIAAAPPARYLQAGTPPPFDDSTQSLGTFLFQDQLFNIELAGLILTVSMVGAIVIARRRIHGAEGFETTGETLLGPATPVDDNPHSIPVYGTTNPSLKAFPET